MGASRHRGCGVEQKGLRYMRKRCDRLWRATAQPAGERSLRRKLIVANVQFYHLTTTPLERALPRLLTKAHAGGFKTLLVAESEERVEQLNQLLWTYDPGSFLPHGSIKDGNAEHQPILISTEKEALNQANMLFIVGGSMTDKTDQ